MELPMDKRKKIKQPKDKDEEDKDEIFDASTPPQILKVIDPPREKIKPLHPHLPKSLHYY